MKPVIINVRFHPCVSTNGFIGTMQDPWQFINSTHFSFQHVSLAWMEFLKTLARKKTDDFIFSTWPFLSPVMLKSRLGGVIYNMKKKSKCKGFIYYSQIQQRICCRRSLSFVGIGTVKMTLIWQINNSSALSRIFLVLSCLLYPNRLKCLIV